MKVENAVKKYPSTPGQRKPPSSDENGDAVEKSSTLDLPNMYEVRKDEWDSHKFNRESALKVEDAGDDDSGYDFFINMDNIHLLTEKKYNSKIDNKLLDARYKYGMVLLGIALLKDNEDSSRNDELLHSDYEESSIYEKINYLTKVVSPILLPMISGLSELQEEQFIREYEEV